MWDKLTRQAIFAAIYQVLFYQDQDLEWDIDWEYILDNTSKTTEDIDLPTPPSLASYLDIFYKERVLFEKYLKHRLSNWDNTFPLIKACLYTFLTEYNSLVENGTQYDKLVLLNKYIKLAQEVIGGQNVTLVHAVISKTLEAGLTIE